MNIRLLFPIVVIAIGGGLYLLDASQQKNNNEQPLLAELSKANQMESSLESVELHKQEYALDAVKSEGQKVDADEEIEVNENINSISSSSEHLPMYADSVSQPEESYVSSTVDASPESVDIFALNETNNTQVPTNPDFSAYGKSITVNEHYLLNLKAGKIVNLPLEINRVMRVEKVERRKNGSTKLSLSFPDESNVYRGFITVGTKATYGRIVTPEGSFELEAVNGNGWVIDTRNIDDKMPVNGIDYVVPDI